MPTLSEYFESEARDMLGQLERGLRSLPVPDAGELHRAARAVRGAAQMAREDRVYRAAGALESALRSVVAGQLSWSDDVAQRLRATLEDLHVLLEGSGAGDELDARADAVAVRWREAGVQLPGHSASGAEREGKVGAGASAEFREFAAREVAGIADALDAGVQQLTDEPMNREPLKMILRRQRALLGAARLDEVPVVAEVLRAVEDLTRVIAKLDIGVKREWLDIYRVARDGLRSAVAPLERNDDPQPSHALSRLRHMREELLERYGTGEAVSAAHGSGGLVQATALEEPPDPPELHDSTEPSHETVAVGIADDGVELLLLDESNVGDGEPAEAAAGGVVYPDAAGDEDVVPVEQLVYDRDAALRRVLDLRAAIYAAAGEDPQALAAADELFDLVHLAIG